jgi:hypothetical protein
MSYDEYIESEKVAEQKQLLYSWQVEICNQILRCT